MQNKFIGSNICSRKGRVIVQYTNANIKKKKKINDIIKKIFTTAIYIIIIPIILYNIFLIIMAMVKPHETPSFFRNKNIYYCIR